MTVPVLVLVTSSFPIAGDGSEAAGSFVADLVEELARHIHVRVVAPGPETKCEHWADRIDVHRFAAPSRPLSTLRMWHPGDLHCIAKILRAGQQATHQAATDGAQHIVALWGLPCGEWAHRAASRQGIGYSVWMLGSDVWSLGRIPLLRGALRRVIQQAQHAYADGYQLAADAEKIGKTPVSFLPSTRRIGLQEVAAPRSQPPYRLLFLGRWHHNKGVDLLLDALAQLDDSDWQQIERVEIQGGGPLHDLVHERTSVLQSKGRPVIAGRYLTKPEAETAIAQADWLLIPSRIESIPVVFSDAMKLGRPVIAMPVGDLTRLGNQFDIGLISGKISANAFARSIRTAIKTPQKSRINDIRECADLFDISKIANKLESSINK